LHEGYAILTNTLQRGNSSNRDLAKKSWGNFPRTRWFPDDLGL